MIVASIVALSCGQEDSDVAITTISPVVEAAESDSGLHGATSDDSMRSGNADDPFASFGFSSILDAEATTLRSANAWIINRSPEDAVVRADGGAGAVLVDTVAAGDSLEVRLESRVDSLLLTAVDVAGVEMGRKWLDLRAPAVRAVFP